jgi:carbon-monoxide dehydrogenase large subunit
MAALPSATHGVEPGLAATHFFQPPDIAYPSGAHVVLAEVDPASAGVKLDGYWIPPLAIDHLETPSPLNPLGLKGVGESGDAAGGGRHPPRRSRTRCPSGAW